MSTEPAAAHYRHALPDCIFPDTDIVDPSKRHAAVNALVLYDLAKRAERNADPYENLAEIYEIAESTWTPDLLATSERAGN